MTRIVGLTEGLAQLQRDIEAEIDGDTRQRTFGALEDVKNATPVDTGRARNSWQARPIGENERGLRQYEVKNPVNYIGELNMGSSRQAGANFIEESFLRYFDEVAVDVYRDPNGVGGGTDGL